MPTRRKDNGGIPKAEEAQDPKPQKAQVMPVVTKKRGDKYRVIEKETGKIAKNKTGTSLDGGGHKSKAAAEKQASAVNISQARKRGRKIPKK